LSMLALLRLTRAPAAFGRSGIQHFSVSAALARADTAASEAADAASGTWKSGSRRTGLIAIKCGMTAEWDAHGERIPLTVLAVDECQVVQAKDAARHGFSALQLGSSIPKPKNIKKPQAGHFAVHSVPPKRHLTEFKVSDDAMLAPGTKLTAMHFVPGQFIDVQGVSIGKGFQGVVRRWSFGRQPASHGTSRTERAHGSTGGCQDPGKVWKGKKMAGHMGNKKTTQRGLLVYKVDPVRNLIYVKGSVVGHKGTYLRVKDTQVWGKMWGTRRCQMKPPFPTFIPKEGEPLPQEPLVAPASTTSPFAAAL